MCSGGEGANESRESLEGVRGIGECWEALGGVTANECCSGGAKKGDRAARFGMLIAPFHMSREGAKARVDENMSVAEVGPRP